MTEEAILLLMVAKTNSRIEELLKRISIQEGILADLMEQLATLPVPARSGEPEEVAVVPGSSQLPNAKPTKHTAPTKGGGKPTPPPESDGVGEGQVESWAKRIADVLRDGGGTMRFGEIVAELERRGETTLGKQRLGSRVFGVLRRRKNRFEKLSRGEYRLIP